MRNVTMPNYTKLFSTIVTSTIWQEPDRTRIVWITMLALSDKNGEIHASIPGLARVAGVPVEDCEKALAAFLSPDGYSRTTEHEGRRIAKIDGGWELLNFQKYRLLASTADTLAKNANRQKKWRQRNGQVTDSNAPVTHSNGVVTVDSRKAESDSKAKSDLKEEERAPAKNRGTLETVSAFCLEIGLPKSDGAASFYKWEGNGWMNGGKAIKDWKATIRSWKEAGYMPSQKNGTAKTTNNPHGLPPLPGHRKPQQ